MKILNDQKNRDHGSSNSAEIALIYVGLGNNDQAMAWLERAYEERFNPSILARPSFDPLRSDQRFQDLMHRIGLSNYPSFVILVMPVSNGTGRGNGQRFRQ